MLLRLRRIVRAASLWGVVVGLLVFTSGVASATPAHNSNTFGLVGAWEFTENALDSSGNGNHGVVHGATLTTDRFGNPNSAYSFDGVDDYIFVAPDLGGLTEFTKTLWLAPRASIYGSLFRTPNGGIGYGIALRAAALGMDVAVLDLHGGVCDEAAAAPNGGGRMLSSINLVEESSSQLPC